MPETLLDQHLLASQLHVDTRTSNSQDTMQHNSHDPVLILYPTQTIYTRPLCQKDYAIYSSWTRHLSCDHPTHKVEMVFECSACGQQYPSKRSVATHFRKSHDDLSEPDRSQPTSGSWNCEFCISKYPTKKSLGQHVRNNHASEASEKRDHSIRRSQKTTLTFAIYLSTWPRWSDLWLAEVPRPRRKHPCPNI